MNKYCEYCSHLLDSSFDCFSCIYLDRRPYGDNTVMPVMLDDLFMLSPSIVSRKGTPEWIRKGDEKEKKMSKELVEIVRCKNCIHRPTFGKGIHTFGKGIHSINPPKNSRGDEDYTCPCLNEDDPWYSWRPSDEWFCAEGEVKGEQNE